MTSNLSDIIATAAFVGTVCSANDLLLELFPGTVKTRGNMFRLLHTNHEKSILKAAFKFISVVVIQVYMIVIFLFGYCSNGQPFTSPFF